MPPARLGTPAGLVLLVLAALAAVTLGARPGVVLPDLVLPLVLTAALLRGPAPGAVLGLVGGWLVDLMPPGAMVLGSSALLYAAAGLLAGAARREGLAPLGWVGVVALACTALTVTGRLGLALLAGSAIDLSLVGLRAVLTAALCILAVPVLAALHRRLQGWVAP